MRLRGLWLPFILTYLGTAVSQDAVALFGGTYPPYGYMNNEVEVWSRSSSCKLEIPSTPDLFQEFQDGPGAAVLDDNIYVCGGYRMHGTTRTCDIYSMTDKTWYAGPSLYNEYPMKVNLATAGSRLVAAYTIENSTHGEYWQTTDQLVVSVLDPETSPQWSVLTVLKCDDCWYFLEEIGQVDENHVAFAKVGRPDYPPNNHSEALHVVNIETGKVTNVDTPNNDPCNNPLVFNGLFSCIFEPDPWTRILHSLTFNGEDGLQHEWTEISSFTKIDYYNPIRGPFLQLDGKLTALGSVRIGIIYWKDELEDEGWNLAKIEIPRDNFAWTILQCN